MKFGVCPECWGLRPAELRLCVYCSERSTEKKYRRRYQAWKQGADVKTLLLSLLSPVVPPPLPYRHKAVTLRSGRKLVELADGSYVEMKHLLKPLPQKVLLPLMKGPRGFSHPRGMEKIRPWEYRTYDFAPGWALVWTSDRGVMERGYALTYAKVWTMSSKMLRVKLIQEAL